MQGHRSAIGSLPETLGFDHGSTSNDPVIDQQICWTNNMRNNAQNRVSDYISPSDTNVTYMNTVSQEGQNLSGWNIGEPSSSGTQNDASRNEGKIEHNWLSSMDDCTRAGQIFEERQYELSNTLSLNNANVNVSNDQIGHGSVFLRSCTSDSVPQDLNVSSGFVGPRVDDSQGMEILNPYKASSSGNLPDPSPNSMPDSFGGASGSGGYLVEENEGRRLSCKRKALEGNVGQSSGSESSNYFHRGESVWRPGYAGRNGNRSLSISSSPSENSPRVEVNPRLGLAVGGVASETRPNALNAAQSVESSRRNFRLRINASNQQDSIPTNMFSTGSAVGHSNLSNPHLLRLHPLNNLDLAAPPPPPPPPPAADTTNPHVPRRNLPSSRWNRGSSSRSGASSGAFPDAAAYEEPNSRTVPRNISDHPMFVPLAQNVVNMSFNNGGNLSINGSGASTSRAGSSSSVHPSSASNWIPHRHPSHYPRRLTELVRRSFMASTASESGGQNSNFPSSSSQELPLSSGEQGRHVSHSRSAMLLDRQLEGAFGIPYSMRTLAAAGEGRSRLVSEHIRNVLDIMRRGEGLRFEELLALEERIGNVNTGLSEETISTRLKQRKYVCVTTGQFETEPCCICQEEYNNGEDLGKLECGHDFHSECIKQWLTRKNLCPICKTTGLKT
ncbi:hypothetical protein LguiB_017308 [Lonicera macranthoides]